MTTYTAPMTRTARRTHHGFMTAFDLLNGVAAIVCGLAIITCALASISTFTRA